MVSNTGLGIRSVFKCPGLGKGSHFVSRRVLDLVHIEVLLSFRPLRLLLINIITILSLFSLPLSLRYYSPSLGRHSRLTDFLSLLPTPLPLTANTSRRLPTPLVITNLFSLLLSLSPSLPFSSLLSPSHQSLLAFRHPHYHHSVSPFSLHHCT